MYLFIYLLCIVAINDLKFCVSVLTEMFISCGSNTTLLMEAAVVQWMILANVAYLLVSRLKCYRTNNSTVSLADCRYDSKATHHLLTSQGRSPLNLGGVCDH